jgi:hypothetical protein
MKGVDKLLARPDFRAWEERQFRISESLDILQAHQRDLVIKYGHWDRGETFKKRRMKQIKRNLRRGLEGMIIINVCG